MNLKYELLDWDSDFFGFKVGRISEQGESENELADALKLLNKQKVDLIYYARDNALEEPEGMSDLYDITLVDKKTTYVKELQGTLVSNTLVSTYLKDSPDEKLLDLAIESGVYSRFNVDEKIGKEKYQELYRLWITNSVNKRIAKEVFVYQHDDELTGFVTLGEKNGRADIGLIAVKAPHRGRGIGKALMYSAEKWFIDNKYNVMQVVTQGENTAACKLYESCGYVVDKVEYFYHLWRNVK